VENETLTVAQTGVERLYEQNSGPVFAHCFARVGSRNVAEWAVNATFDRARAALENGGIAEPELDWLLRTADKFCAPKLCLDASPFASMVVVQNWRGRSFDEIATELEARHARLEEERKRLTPWRRVLGAFNLGPAVSWVKGLLGGLGAVKATVAAVGVVGAVAVVATPVATKLHHAVRPGPGSTPAATSAKSSPARPASQAGQPSGAVATRRRAAVPPKPHQAAVRHAPTPTAAGSSQTGLVGAGQTAVTHPSRAGSSPAPAPQHASSAGGVSATLSVTTTANITPKQPAPQSSTAAVATVTPITPDPSLPKSPTAPTAPTATVPSAPDAPTVTAPSVDTPTVPSVSTPSVPSVTAPTLP
jgi:hypothetical protein